MKISTASTSCLILAVLLAVLADGTVAPSGAAESRRAYSTNASDRIECEKQLNKIFEALTEYRQQKQKLPNWLSDLEPEFIHDPKILTCPVVRSTGDLKSWRKGILDVVLSDVHTSYTYEFCLSYVPTNQWAGAPKTYRQYKERQMEKLGNEVPIVRCMAHNPMLNLAVGGRIFESGLYWERVFLSVVEEDLQPGPLFAAEEESPEALRRRLPARSAEAPAELLDLTANYNRALTDTFIPHRPMYRLVLSPGVQTVNGARFDARGVVQLGCGQLGPPFPEEVTNISIRRACTAIHFLHGTVFSAPFGTKIGDFVVHYADGQTEEVPVIYGRDVKDVTGDATVPDTVGARPAWQSPDDGKSAGVALYQLTWQNRRYPMVVHSVDFRSSLAASAPFLVAITVARD